MRQNIFRVLIVLWGGSLWSLAAWVAITVFHMLGRASLAGPIAARLFSIETYLGLAVAAAALALPARRRLGALYAAAGLLLVNEWVLKPCMSAALAQGSALGLAFGAWHGVSAVIYVAACVCVLRVVWRESYRIDPRPKK
jgi:Domain of unknown function (DUF4149)